MSAGTPAKKNAAYTFDVALRSATDSVSLQSNPTLAAGDVKVSTDNGAFANLGTLPAVSPASGIQVKVTMSAAEMNGDDIGIAFIDQTSPKEWCDLFVFLKTSTRQIDDLAFPTTSGRSIDVTTGGAVGIDWANVESPTTAVNLSATNIDVDQVVASVSGAVGSVTGLTAATVHSDLDDIQARLPAALVSGRIDASVGAMAANVLTATAINADAITAAKIADGAIDAATFAAGAIDAAAIAANAIGASELAADVVDDIWMGTALTESYAANAATGTPAQLLYAIHQMLMQFSIASTTMTVKKLDNSTTAFLVTLDSATAPTSAVRT